MVVQQIGVDCVPQAYILESKLAIDGSRAFHSWVQVARAEQCHKISLRRGQGSNPHEAQSHKWVEGPESEQTIFFDVNVNACS